MAKKKKIIAFPFHEEEWSNAKQVMQNINETESFVVGEINERDIVKLREKGVIIKILEEEPIVETPAAVQRPMKGIEIEQMIRQPLLDLTPKIARIDPAAPNFFLIKLHIFPIFLFIPFFLLIVFYFPYIFLSQV